MTVRRKFARGVGYTYDGVTPTRCQCNTSNGGCHCGQLESDKARYEGTEYTLDRMIDDLLALKRARGGGLPVKDPISGWRVIGVYYGPRGEVHIDRQV